MVNPIEAVADAIMHYEAWSVGSRSYRNRNPGNLRAWAVAYPKDDGGYTIFPSLPVGYSALCDDLTAKFTGHNPHGLGPDSTLLQMMEVYAPLADGNDPGHYARFIAAWLILAGVGGVTASSTLREIAPDLAYPPAPGVDISTGIA